MRNKMTDGECQPIGIKWQIVYTQQIIDNHLHTAQLVKNGFYKIHTKYINEKISEK